MLALKWRIEMEVEAEEVVEVKMLENYLKVVVVVAEEGVQSLRLLNGIALEVEVEEVEDKI